MPRSYDIQSPKGEQVSPALQAKLSMGLQQLGVPQGDGWRYVVLPDQNWIDTVKAYGQTMPHHTGTAFSNLPGKVTYLRQGALESVPNDTFMTTLAHEYGHRLFGPKESTADTYARNAVQQWQKNGVSNEGANMALQSRVAAQQGQQQPVTAPVNPALQPMGPSIFNPAGPGRGIFSQK